VRMWMKRLRARRILCLRMRRIRERIGRWLCVPSGPLSELCLPSANSHGPPLFKSQITLALVNPLLWWLIDRSKSGFLLSAAVGLAGSMLLLGVNPAMMPTPSVTSDFFRNNASSAVDDEDELMMMLGGLLARNETVESGVWMLSVLFCSCVCFGNIGRRLAWGSSAVVKGRWGGVR